ncbi:MAG: NAD(P)/FAD-dependent oxidoreductase [Firmicutes bacterium]|nr:NAD(P)/FAD-dependent oxidoreductase [Bacillota bacterium]
MYDVIIIGAGVIGTNIAKELSYYDLKLAVIEKNNDVCEETSKANSGIVHSGYDATPNTLKAKYNVLGNKMMASTCKELDVPFIQNGSLIIGFSEEDLLALQSLQLQGIENGVEGLKILNKDEIFKMEPQLHPEVLYALYAPTGGIVDPFQLTIAPAEVAFQNKTEFFFNTFVEGISNLSDFFEIQTNQGKMYSKSIVNAAGIHSDTINNYVSQHKLDIRPRKGEYCLFDKEVGNIVHSTIFQLPSSKGKGVLVTPTAEGNLLIGPSSIFVEGKEDTATTLEGVQYILEKASSSIKSIPFSKVITGFAGLRASEIGKDFVIGESPDVKNFYNAAGIESPGLTAAPAIALDLALEISLKLHAKKKEHFISTRKAFPRFESQTMAEKKRLIEEFPEYGKIICRCELVTLAEIKNAIHRPLGAKTVDAVKRRTRAGSGRCQGGFCSPRVLEILAKELHKDVREISKFNEKSTFLVGLDKEL